jgi:hypothetical protein
MMTQVLMQIGEAKQELHHALFFAEVKSCASIRQELHHAIGVCPQFIERQWRNWLSLPALRRR